MQTDRARLAGAATSPHNSGVRRRRSRIALQFVPTLLFGVWGGVIADRFDKRTVLVLHRRSRWRSPPALLARARRSPASSQLWMVYAIVFVFGLALAVDNPARLVVRAPRWSARPTSRTRSGSNSALFQVARIVGPAVAGVLIVAVGTGAVLRCSTRCRSSLVIGALLVMRTRGAAPRARRSAGRRARSATACATCGETPELRSIAAAHPDRRHARDQLPGGAAAPGQGHVRRRTPTSTAG